MTTTSELILLQMLCRWAPLKMTMIFHFRGVIMDTLTLLKAIRSAEPSDFSDLCNALGDDKPERGDRDGWSDLFNTLRSLEKDGLVQISWFHNKNVDSLMLTEAGAARVRESQ
jgi:hypothetical protein